MLDDGKAITPAADRSFDPPQTVRLRETVHERQAAAQETAGVSINTRNAVTAVEGQRYRRGLLHQPAGQLRLGIWSAILRENDQMGGKPLAQVLEQTGCTHGPAARQRVGRLG
jgi:hypothetical protein